ncbi:MAG: MFS transporter [Bacteroidetes bacterium]|nr:MFS transporter [Bacteroidota bacterium]
MQKRILVFLLSAVKFTHIMDVMIMMPLSDIFMKEFGIRASQFSFLISSYAIGAFLSSLLGVFTLDFFGRRQSLLFVYGGFTISTFFCGWAGSYEALLGIRFVTGIFGGLIGALALAIVSDLYSFKERGKAIGILMAAFSAASALGVPFGLYFAAVYSWSFPFYFLAAAGLLLFTMIYFTMPEMEAHTLQEKRSIRRTITDIIDDSNQVRALWLGVFLVLGHFLVIPFITPSMVRNVGFEQYQISYIYLAGGILTIVTGPLIGWITDRYGALKTFFVVVVLSFVPVIFITHMGPTSIPVALIVTSAFFVLGSGRMISPNTMITAAVGPKTRGSFMSVKSALQQLSVAVASLVAGAIVFVNEAGELDHYYYVGYLSIGFCLLAMWLAPKLKVASGN